MTTNTRAGRTVATITRLYEDRTGCPTRHHNTRGAYRMGCRCPEAREDRRVADKRLRNGYGPPRSHPATGSTRRLQALMALGWTANDIAAALPSAPEHVRDIARGARRRVLAATATGITDLYEKWSGTPGPSKIGRRRAAAKGWLPPLAWDDVDIDDPTVRPNLGGSTDELPDPVEVEAALNGGRAWRDLRHADRTELIAVADRCGVKSAVLADRLGVHHSTLHHFKARQAVKEVAA